MLNKIFILLVFLPMSLFSQQVSSSSNPCEEKPPSQQQMNDCAAFQYEQADTRLSKVFSKALAYMVRDQERAKKSGDQRQIDYEKIAIESLKKAESAWIVYRDLQCDAAGQQYEGGSMRPMIESQCLANLTEHRITDLKSVYEDGDRKLE